MIVLGEDEFSKDLAKEAGAEFMQLKTKIFPDGESYIRITEPKKIKGRKIVPVIRKDEPDLNQDRLITKSILVLDKLTGLEADKICLFLPYMPYARQDKEFIEGETASVKIIRRTLQEKCDVLLNVTNHDFRKEGWVSEGVYNIDGADSAIDFLKGRGFRKPAVIAPDMRASPSVEKIAKALGGESLVVEKKRDYETGEIEVKAELPDLSGKELIIFDDVAASGGTLYKAIQMGKEANAEKITCVVVHVISMHNKKSGKNSIEMIKDECDEYFASDTISSPITSYSVVKKAAEFLRESFRGE